MTQIEIITKELKERKISQKEFCDALHINESTFSTWKLRGSRIPSKHIVSVCNYFNWPSEVLLNCEDETPSNEFYANNSNLIQNNLSNSNNITSNMVISHSNGIESEFFKLFNSLSLSAKAKVISYATELSEGENAE